VRLDLTGSGAGTYDDGSDPAVEVTATLAVDAEPLTGKLTFDERVVGNVVYFRLQDISATLKESTLRSGNVPPIGVDAVVGMVKGAIGGKWVKLDPKEIAELDPSSDPEVLAMFNPEKLRALNKKMTEAMRANPIFVLRADLGNDRVGKVSAYHYRVGIRVDSVQAILGALAGELGANARDLAEMQTVLAKDEVRQAIEKVDGEVWIAKGSQDLTKIAFPVEFTAPDGTGKPLTVKGRVEVTYSDWGKQVKVEVPADAKSIRDLMGAVLGGPTSGLPMGDGVGGSGMLLADPPTGGIRPGTVRASGADGDDDGLSDSEEAFYGSNPGKADTDGDGFTDGDEVGRGYSPTEKGKKLFEIDLQGDGASE
jgi:hypothetical protein